MFGLIISPDRATNKFHVEQMGLCQMVFC